jgi:UPF0716 protein FxsA
MKSVQMIGLLLLAIPLIEIYLLIEVGSLIGVLPTIIVIVATAVWGIKLWREQGFATWKRLQQTLQRGEIPAYEVIEGTILLVGGALLLAPGFFTDMLGFLCLIPTLRRAIAQYLIEHRLIQPVATAAQAQNHRVLEGEFHKEP